VLGLGEPDLAPGQPFLRALGAGVGLELFVLCLGDRPVVRTSGDLVIQPPLPFVDGTEIDFQREGLNAQFVFRNPNATGECGCGESFTVAPAA
jgi:iron-sulfur cluster assembly protein